MCIHLFQVSMLSGFAYHVLYKQTQAAFSPEITEITPVLPLIVEAIVLVIIGSAALILGSLV